MKIGIDIDNCISNFDDTLLKEYLKHDKELRNTGIINENAESIRRGMFDWTEKEETQAAVEVVIRDTLWQELPESYNDSLFLECRRKVYEFVYTTYPAA